MSPTAGSSGGGRSTCLSLQRSEPFSRSTRPGLLDLLRECQRLLRFLLSRSGERDLERERERWRLFLSRSLSRSLSRLRLRLLLLRLFLLLLASDLNSADFDFIQNVTIFSQINNCLIILLLYCYTLNPFSVLD